MKVLRKDEDGDETLHAPFIIVMSFIGVSILLIAMTSSIQYYGASREDYLEGYETIGGLEFVAWVPTDGYDVTPNDTQIDHADLTDPVHTWASHLETDDRFYVFTHPPGMNKNAIRVFVIRNSTDYDPTSDNVLEQDEDFFLITGKTSDYPIPNWRRAIVPFSDVLRNVGMEGADDNTSQVHFMIGSMNVTLFVHANSDLAFHLDDNDNYTIGIGTPIGENYASKSMWTVLGQILTLRIPDCHPAVRALIAIPLWAGIGFLAITFVSRFIPLIGGG